MNNKFSRRAVVASLAALTLPLPAFALSGSAAESLVNAAVADINKIIASGKSERAMQSDFQRVFERYADVNIIALTTLGPARRSASKAEVSAFVKAFKGYFTRKYGKRFHEFVGGQIIVEGSRASKSNVEVQSTAKLRGSAPFKVTWLVSDKSGSPKIFNIIIEGVNTLTSERAEIGAMLDKRRGDIGALTADLNKLG
ncbi:MlaC/ttg2D family ABC transporter substrate-binding protein [Litoreibacter albidus]|uniref:Phospholipid transport system substrate-binding protein n=1 Tax=Litoreibacter albidus TaxID=670155 RepID=A0A1H2VU41_9RHOB|nr:ABC transporter substrate-binding protein [Litoreibacter albidus]SDW71731.1 phospholipid transport system substrate-binding protein [Litoreibacter albidus]